MNKKVALLSQHLQISVEFGRLRRMSPAVAPNCIRSTLRAWVLLDWFQNHPNETVEQFKEWHQVRPASTSEQVDFPECTLERPRPLAP
jgi:hypothetical protein